MLVPFVYGPNDLRLCEVESPRAGPGDVVVRVAAVGICGSDLGFLAAGGVAGPSNKPIPLGHELAGTVVEVGEDVGSVGVGSRVVLNPLVNMVGNGGPEGGFAEQLLIRDVVGKPQSLIPLPDAVPFETGALVEPLAVAVHAVNRLGAAAGDRVAVFGAGPIGLASVAVLRQRGVEDIVVFDLSATRRERATQLGARAVLDPLERPVEAVLKDLHGEARVFSSTTPRTTHFLEASGAPILPEIVGLAGVKSTICVVSVQKKPVPLDFQRVLGRELTLTGALGYPTELPDALAMLASGVIDLAPIVSHRFQGADFMAAFDMARQADKAAKVIVRYDT